MSKEKIEKLIKIFFNEKFIKFCIIGVLNTIIHTIIYNLIRNKLGSNDLSGTIANTIAFISASIFSYFANSIFTYKVEIQRKTFLLSAVVFTVKLFFSDGLEYLFSYIFTKLSLLSLIKFNPIFITIIILPMQFLVFNKIFKGQKYDEKQRRIIPQNEV